MPKNICLSCREYYRRTFTHGLEEDSPEELEEGCDKGYYNKKGEITIRCDGFEKETRQDVLQGR